MIRYLLLLATLSVACQSETWGQWIPIPHTEKIDSGFVGGKMEYFWTMEVSRDRVCVDSVRKDSTRGKK